MPSWKLKIAGEQLPSNPLTVDIKKAVGDQQVSQDLKSSSEQKASQFAKTGASGKSKGFRLPSSRNQS